ncbi:hypothetical protein ABEB36_006179 [Hypothenemus hampei]|uniref:Putative nuclease HARBI1 n=1 Tax=Hypothenemus hampei TaxID=57062 RepID=A0ABD1EPN2_HYPHA
MNFEDLSDDEDILELVNIELFQNVRAQKVFRIRENHFQKWNDTEFFQRFRLSKNGVRFVLTYIANDIAHPTERNHALSAEMMLLFALRYYATGSFLQVCGDFIGIDKGTASRVIHKVSRSLAGLYTTFIKMPETEEEMRTNSSQFFNIARFPKCIGAVDCSHIKISSPGGNQAKIYRNRKQYFSYNVQAVCDSQLKFQDVVCRWPGSALDSTIFNNSILRAKFENAEFSDYVLVGDSGYGIRPFLITPLANPRTSFFY